MKRLDNNPLVRSQTDLELNYTIDEISIAQLARLILLQSTIIMINLFDCGEAK